MNEIGDTIILKHHLHREKDKKYLVEEISLKKSMSHYYKKYLITLISQCGKHKCTTLIYSKFRLKKTRIILIERRYNYIDI